MIRKTRALINTQALLHNVQITRGYTKHAALIAMLKADAYGHGLLDIARCLLTHSAVDAIGVALLDEALILSKAGISLPIIVFQGAFHPDAFALAAEKDIQLVLHTPSQIALLSTLNLPKPLHVWLKINTGMNRLGVLPEAAADLFAQLNALAQVAKPVRCMTHFANVNGIHHGGKTQQQIACFDKTLATFNTQYPIECSLAKSAAILHSPHTCRDFARPGLMLYGASPIDGTRANDYQLKPVMTLRSELMAIQSCHQGNDIGYDATWQCPEDMPVGIAAIGYADGYPRHVPNGTPVLLNGKPVQLIGRVSMDMLAIDLRTQPHARIGDPVTLWGDGLPVEEIATYANTTAYELLSQVTARVERVIV